MEILGTRYINLIESTEHVYVYKKYLEHHLRNFEILFVAPSNLKKKYNLDQICNKIIDSYLQFGTFMKECPDEIMIILYDQHLNKVIAGRDRLGILPLYWAGNKEKIVLSLSSRKIVELGHASSLVNLQSIDDFLTLQYIPDNKTMWKEISKVPPGHEIVWQGHSGIKIRKYWDVNFSGTNKYTDKTEQLNELLNEIYKTIELNNSELCMISGGIDTSTNICFLKEHFHQPDGLTVTFKEAEFDESYFAKEVATHYGIKHIEIPFVSNDLYLLDEMVQYFDEPNGDQASLASYVALKKLKGQYNILYSGEGGDEVFGLPRKFSLSNPNEKSSDLKQLAFNYVTSLQYLDVGMRKSIYKNSFSKDINFYNVQEIFEKYFREIDSETVLSKLVYAQIKTWLIDNVLAKDRQVANANKFTTSFPLVNTKLIEFIYSIPEEELYKVLYNKNLMREVLKYKLPSKILNKPKHTFLVPMQIWFAEQYILEKNFKKILQNDHPIYNFINREALVKMIEMHRSKKFNLSLPLWQILALSTWIDSAIITF